MRTFLDREFITDSEASPDSDSAEERGVAPEFIPLPAAQPKIDPFQVTRSIVAGDALQIHSKENLAADDGNIFNGVLMVVGQTVGTIDVKPCQVVGGPRPDSQLERAVAVSSSVTTWLYGTFRSRAMLR